MNKKYLLPALVITVIAQLSIPLKMIYDSEITEREGKEYKFKTVPIDPTDFLRGKYIILNYELENYPSQDTTFISGEYAYAVLTEGAGGFAKIASLHHDKPKDENNYVFAEVHSSYAGKINLEFPFNRFYMNEHKAKAAETAYAEYSERKAKPAYALIAVKEGNAVVKDVIVDGVPIKDYVEKEQQKEKP